MTLNEAMTVLNPDYPQHEGDAPIGIFDKFLDFYAGGEFTDVLAPIHSSLNEMSIDYYWGRSGRKQISPLFERLLSMKEHVDVDERLARMILAKFRTKWMSMYATIGQFNIDDVRFSGSSIGRKTGFDNEDITFGKTVTEDVETSSKEITSTTDNVYGFNSTTGVPSSTTEVTSSSPKADNTSHNAIENGGMDSHARDYEEEYENNSREEPIQKLKELEIRFRNSHELWDIMFKDIDSVLVRPTYV